MIGIANRLRRRLYSWGLIASERLPRPVISIGNLSVGGTGKTPHVRWIAGWLKGRGLRVAILSRGYGRTSHGVVWVSDGERILSTCDQSGDEPFLLASRLKGVPVLVGESRAAAGRACLEKMDVDLFLLDDGFQHLALKRDLDILLVDAGRGLGNRLTLPFGPLREPPSHARYADALVVSKCRDRRQGEETSRKVPFPLGRPVAMSGLKPCVIVKRDGSERPLDPPGKPVSAFSSLARNDQFAGTLKAAGYDVRSFTGFGDHHRFTESDIGKILASAKGLPIMTTEKDLVRLPPGLPFEVEALSVDIEWLEGWGGLATAIETILGKHP
ncbi:MAG TPA: tetraacyldisaccharide 4'-kinase [Candidatus Deferrimicrobiaceae bacterium]